MTQHEQKPEGAEFRTREVVIPLFAPAGKQLAYEHFHEGKWKRVPYRVYIDLPGACRIIEEERPALVRLEDAQEAVVQAEARGAAEQRREDAEGAEAVGRVTGHWADGTPMFDGWETDKPMPLGAFVYDRPANVAALEARVKELEGQLGALQNGAVRQVIHSPLRHFKPEDARTAIVATHEQETAHV